MSFNKSKHGKKNKDESKNSKTNKTLKSKKNSFLGNSLTVLLEIVFIIGIVFSGYKIVIWIMDNINSNQIKNELQEYVSTNVESDDNNTQKELDANDYDINFKELTSINSDTVGWLKINNTNIEYPIVKAQDNEYYLNTDFKKKPNGTGWVFADYRNKFDGNDKNIKLYGHNRKDASMFGTLKDMLEADWYNNKANQNIVFITKNEKANYRIFSMYRLEVEEYYLTTSFTNDTYKDFIKTIKSRSIHNFNIDVTSDDSILTLSTCSGSDYRVVVHAKKI